MMLFAADVPLSDKATDPGAWATLVERIGVGGFFALTFFLLFAILTVCALRWTLGENGFVRVGVLKLFAAWEALVLDLRSGLADLQQHASAQRDAHQHERMSTEQLHAAGVHFAELGRAIGRHVGAQVDSHADEIVRTLTVPPAA